LDKEVYMRVIAGTARRLPLKTVPGLDTRPTTDRIKETLFNMIQNDLPNSVFLDLFSGSGGIGIESLSRGAEKAVFVENNSKAYQCIVENLEFTKLKLHSKVIKRDVITAIRELDSGEYLFDFVFMDPPYKDEIEKEVLIELKKTHIIHEHTQIIIESLVERDFSYVNEMGYEIVKEKKYKTNKHIFLRLKQEDL
jgi:16S rRNA (guanine966-N2)-methyltransferase